MWMSDARDLYASTMIWFARRMTALSFSSSSPALVSGGVADVLGSQVAEDHAERVLAGIAAAYLSQERQDVLPQPDRPLDLPVLQSLADAVDALQILRIVDEDDDAVVLTPERQPEVAPHVLDPEAFHEIRRRDDLVVVLDERAFVVLAQRDPELVLRDLVLLDQDRLDIGLTPARLGHRGAQLLGRD